MEVMTEANSTNPNAALLREIQRFMDRHNMSDTGFSRHFMNNPNFVERLHNHDFSPLDRTVKALKRSMREYEALRGVNSKKS